MQIKKGSHIYIPELGWGVSVVVETPSFASNSYRLKKLGSGHTFYAPESAMIVLPEPEFQLAEDVVAETEMGGVCGHISRIMWHNNQYAYLVVRSNGDSSSITAEKIGKACPVIK